MNAEHADCAGELLAPMLMLSGHIAGQLEAHREGPCSRLPCPVTGLQHATSVVCTDGPTLPGSSCRGSDNTWLLVSTPLWHTISEQAKVPSMKARGGSVDTLGLTWGSALYNGQRSQYESYGHLHLQYPRAAAEEMPAGLTH